MGGSIAHPRWSSLPGIPLLIQSFGSQGGSTALFDDVEEDTNPFCVGIRASSSVFVRMFLLVAEVVEFGVFLFLRWLYTCIENFIS